MTTRRSAYDVVPFPPLQHQMMDWLGLMHRKHTIHALIEVDVTSARQAIRALRARTGTPVSFTAFIITCLARAIDADKAMHAYRKGRRHLVLFADVDVTTVVEREVGGHKVPVPHIIRAANKKTVRDIQQEIRAVQEAHHPQSSAAQWLPLWLVLPARVRRFVWARLLHNPHRRKRLTGTVIVTAVGMYGHGTGWGIPMTDYTLCVTVGSIAKKPGLVDQQIAVREYLCLTISVDHDLIDGAPAARFAQRLKELIEHGAGLYE